MQLNIQNILLGTAIGDAFGAGVEFQDRNWIRANVDFSKFINARAQIAVPVEQQILFTENYNAWDYTDDTEMTIGVLKALLDKAPFSESLLIQKWTEEYQKGIKEKGYGRNGHGSMSWYFSGKKTIEEIKDFQRFRKNPGNAPAMRAVPLGLVAPKLINQYAAINANATHPNLNAVIASQCIARAAEFILVLQGDPAKVIPYCMNNITMNKEYISYLNAVDQLPNYAALQTQHFALLCGEQPIPKPYFLDGILGLPSDAKYTTGAVLYILKESNNAFDALKKSIYLGGDVDSVASITVAILAGRYGLASLPAFMLRQVEGTEYLGQLAQQFEATWS